MSCWWVSAGGATPTNAMNEQEANTPETQVNQVMGTTPESIKLGMDVHANSIVVVRIFDHCPPQPAQRFTREKFLHWVKKQLPLAKKIYSCYEAGPLGYGLHRELTAMGIINFVTQPVCLDERHKGVNHDKSDARELASRLDRYLAGNTRAMGVVRVPSPEEEQRREVSRQREQIKREVHRIAAQGRGLLLAQGYRETGEWWGLVRWKVLSTRVPEWLRESLEVFTRVLKTLLQELKGLTEKLEQAATKERPRGMGGLTVETVDREVGDWNRFKNRRQVGGYTGLCVGISASGNTTQLLSITKCGNVRLRTALVELAWRFVVWQPNCPLVKKWNKVLVGPKTTRGAKKKAIVAIARQLAVDIWRWRTGRMKPEQLGWTMMTA